MIFHTINLLILVGLIYFLSRNKLRKYFQDQRAELSTAIDEAEKDFIEIKTKYDEMLARIDGLDTEILNIKKTASAAIETECLRHKKETDLVIRRMLSDADLKNQQSLERAKEDFKERLVQAAFEEAEAEMRSYMKKSEELWISEMLSASSSDSERKNYAS
ncbi:MAG: hypothetical protein EA369_05215 [Bradymonadales bacterium]|nr:MAG: hypothetical protein EA369_05215 [Bradymonadales bacterium]